VLVALVLFPLIVLVERALSLSLPEGLTRSGAGASASVLYVARDGSPLREVRGREHVRASWVAFDDLGESTRAAILAAEDARFALHPGVDPLAVARAAAQLAWNRRVVSGGSTLTMQLARLVAPHPRTLRGKVDEAALALRIEAHLSKRRIFEEYANRAPFGPDVRGIGAASRVYFDKAPRDLSVAEAATLASIPRGPSLYTVAKRPDLVVRRRNRVLGRMRDAGAISDEVYQRALTEPLAPRFSRPVFGAPHLVAGLARGALSELEGGLDLGGARRVVLSIDPDLQSEVEAQVRAMVRPLAGKHVTAGAAIVLDNATGQVLAYVGSPAFDDDKHLGQNDGVVALRQPGSTLKPFVYGLGMERLGLTSASVLPDVELSVELPTGVYRPQNYDERFHGPVRLREALGSSYNVPAVHVALRVGEDALLERLRELGMTSLTRDAAHYGPALALGDGEVRLVDLANAYATLARGGESLPASAVLRVEAGDGSLREARTRPGTRIFPRVVAAAITDILADKVARVPAFGERSALDLPFPAAVKTGTSKAFRDNYAVGFTDRVTVAVWVGNFDGSSMQGVSGVTGAAPVFQAVMLAAMRGHEGERLAASEAEELHDVTVCALSGGAPHAGCSHTVRERVPRGRPVDACAFHTTVEIDTRNGLLAGPECPRSVVRERSVESYPPELVAWARAAMRPLEPTDGSPLCAGRSAKNATYLQITSPRDGARYARDPDRPLSQQTVPVRVAGTLGAPVRLRLDGKIVLSARIGDPLSFALSPGEHVLVAEGAGDVRSDAVRVRVD
jgi:penicillin-binding protein 1C